jgi:transcriptional regulator with XRE-family HTH domain
MENAVDWKQVIADLMAAGESQTKLAEKCGVAQSTISDLYRGASRSPSFDLGRRLLDLHAARVRTEARDAA